MRLIYVLILLFFLSISALYSQNSDLGTWNILNLKYNLNEKWSVFGEGQVRSLKVYDDFNYYEYKFAGTCKVYKNVALTLGAGSYQTYKEGGNFILPKKSDEFRIWPQLVLFQSIGALKIEQRYRAEFRFIEGNQNRNRYRYRLGLSYPFGKEKDGFKPYQINVSDEIFFTDNEPYFERNRFLVALNYKPTKATTLQIGYLSQFDYKINDETGKDFLQVGLFIELFRKQASGTTIENDIKDN